MKACWTSQRMESIVGLSFQQWNEMGLQSLMKSIAESLQAKTTDTIKIPDLTWGRLDLHPDAARIQAAL